MPSLPNMRIEHLPNIKIESIRVKNFKSYKDVTFDFLNKNFACFIGPNGTGKSTIIEIIQLLFGNFNGKTPKQLESFFASCVRKGESDFLIEATLSNNGSKYEISISKQGFSRNHPAEIREHIYRLCYFSTFDKELHKFQLHNEKWGKFKDLYEAVTGFEISPRNDEFDDFFSLSKELSKDFVFDFSIKKPFETISAKDCSDGERKLIKSFSTLLNFEFTPKIILIDNIEMHVEIKRHVNLIKSLKKCFPESQIFVTTHSTRISKNLTCINEIYDLRLIFSPDHSQLGSSSVKELLFLDELDELSSRNNTIFNELKKKENEIEIAKLFELINTGCGIEGIYEKITTISRKVNEAYLNDICQLEVQTNLIKNNLKINK